MSVVLIRSLILYIVVIFGVRLMGKRQLGELQPSELVITILISNIATLPLEDTSIPLILGILPILTLVCFEALMSWVTLKSLRMRRIISGRPKIVVRDGQIEQATMQDLRLSVDDLMTALRQQQVFDISQVQFAVMETTGTISVYLKAECQLSDTGGHHPEKDGTESACCRDTGRLRHEQVPCHAGEKSGLAGTEAGGAPPDGKTGVPDAQRCRGHLYHYSKETGGRGMNRVRLGVAILLTLVLCSCGTAWLVRSETSRLLKQLDTVQQIAETQPEQAKQAFAEFQNQWEKSERRLNLVVWRDKVLQIDVTVSHLAPMQAEDCDELTSELEEVRMWITRLGESEMPFWWNIL